MCGFASCSDVTEPVYTKPDASTFKINTPPLQNQYYGLDENGQFEIALNGQPSHGFLGYHTVSCRSFPHRGLRIVPETLTPSVPAHFRA